MDLSNRESPKKDEGVLFKIKVECQYKEKCYRKKAEHFEEFSHRHLNELLEQIGDNEIHIPLGYNPKVSHLTLKSQLEIVRDLSCKSKCLSVKSKKRKIEVTEMKKEENPSTSQIVNNSQRSSQENNLKLADSFKKLNESLVHLTINEKLDASHPYNILYTSVEDNPEPDRLQIIFPELLDPGLGNLESSLLMNFMVEFGWILACYYIMGHRGKPMTLIYGDCDEELGSRFDTFLTHSKVKPPSPFGTHHTKLMIFSYTDGSIRIVISTANLVESDWINKTQGVWISPKCKPLSDNSSTGESVTNFKKDFLRYLKAYDLNTLEPWIKKVQGADLSEIKVFFVGSVPGSHSLSSPWGQLALRQLLKVHASAPDHNTYEVIVQCSSIGSLGPEPCSWLMGDILETFSANNSFHKNKPPLSVIYPSFANVEASAEGLLGGGCLPYNSVTHKKQEWLINFLKQWKSEKIGRSKAVPHIKSYTRVSSDLTKISYFLLTSANLSKAAWGTITKKPSISILSYEAGVLLIPKILIDIDYFPLVEETVSFSEQKPIFPLPYDVPLTSYNFNDVPWFIDNFPT